MISACPEHSHPTIMSTHFFHTNYIIYETDLRGFRLTYWRTWISRSKWSPALQRSIQLIIQTVVSQFFHHLANCTNNQHSQHSRTPTYIWLAFFCSLNTKLLRPLGLDSPAAATAVMKSKCKISKNSPKILKSKFQKPVLQFFAYWYTDYLRQVSWELDKNCRSSNMKKFDNIQTPGKSRIL